ncbi:MAG: hypothetical protein AMXMBFR82_23640 [Candidatus Hydrogenedentota bacterium]
MRLALPTRAIPSQNDRWGAAAIEAILFSTFFLIPVAMLSWVLLQSTATVHNAIASARHGAFTESVAGVPRYEDQDGDNDVSESADRDVQEDIAYYPRRQGQILSPSAVDANSTEVDVVATVQFNAPYRRSIGFENRSIQARLRMMKRRPHHYDVEPGEMHQSALEAWEGFRTFMDELNAAAESGPASE